MKALSCSGTTDVRVEDVPEPSLAGPGDAIVKVSKAAICGSDLHFYNGRVPGVFEGTVVGHEYVGTVLVNALIALPVFAVARRWLMPSLPEHRRRRRRRPPAHPGLSPLSQP